jgi:hypothetical protein
LIQEHRSSDSERGLNRRELERKRKIVIDIDQNLVKQECLVYALRPEIK